MLTGKNGILTQANEAKQKSEIETEKELVKLAHQQWKILESTGGDISEVSVDGGTVQKSEDGQSLIVSFSQTGNAYKIDKAGNITDPSAVQYDTVPDDFWIVSSGSLTINSEYLTPATYTGAYAYSNNSNSVGKFTCKYTKLEIPSVVNGTTVTKIDNKMPNLLNVTNVKVSGGITEIGDQSLVRWAALTNIELPNSLTKIGNGAFAGCASLRNIDIPTGVTSIGGGAFESCISLENVTIPDSVTSIGNESSGYHLGNGSYLYGGRTFKDCIKLKRIYIPSSVSSIGTTSALFSNSDWHGLFNGCSSDLKIYCGASNAQSGWVSGWNKYNSSSTLTTNYGYTRAAYESAIAGN